MKLSAIGVVGAGDLGKQLIKWFADSGYSVSVFDNGQITEDSAGSLEGLFAASDIVHWCAPLEALGSISELRPSQTLVLHASVMAQSLQAKNTLRKRGIASGHIGIVHLLMNQHQSGVVSSDSDDVKLLSAHLTKAGLSPQTMTTIEHDRAMAVSQAPMALLHELVLSELEQLQAQKLLTPSGEELLAAIHARSIKWTPTTLQSILSNPQIPELIERMHALAS